LARIRLPERAKRASATNFVRELREGWQAFTERTWIWVLTTWISFYFLITYAPFFVLGPYIAKQSLGGAAGWTVVVTGEAIGPVADVIGMSTLLWIGAAWIIVTTAAVLCVPDVRAFRSRDALDAPERIALSGA